MLFPVYKVTRLVPVKIGITGRRRDLPLKLIEFIYPVSEKEIELPDNIKINTAKGNEKLLFYYFYNIVRYYTRSPLFYYIKKSLSRDDVFLDIGANLGFYSYLAKKNCNCRVYLFEPEPEHLFYLNRNQHLFDHIFDFALSDRTGEKDFYVANDKNLGGSSLVMDDRGWDISNYSHTIRTKTKRLDEINIDPNLIKKIKLIKIDVEGAEESVIKGMSGLLKDHNFDIWCEVRNEDSARNPNSYRKICNFLAQFGYQPFIYDGNKLHEVSSKYIKQVFDILFLKNN